MSSRLAKALVGHIHEMKGASKFILMEGISKELALGIAREWLPDLPPLLVGSDDPAAFGDRALDDKAATTIRNDSPAGVVVVACRGFEIPDWQSVARFPSVSPSDLLSSQRGLILLAEASRKVDLDGPLRVVRAAILEAEAQVRPTAQQVADYFDAIAKGEDPLGKLPLIGAFADRDAQGFGTARLLENLRLAHKTFGDSPSSFIEIRKKADRVFQRTARQRTSEDLVRLLQTESASRLEYVTFEEAKSVLDNYVPDLTDQVIQELDDYRRELAGLPDGDDLIREVPWDDYVELARSLKVVDEKKDAARDLLEFDRAHDGKVFQKPTKRKLESLVRERTIAAASDCLEELLVKGALALESPVRRISVIAPFPPDKKGDTRAAAQKIAVLACASFRLKPLLERLSTEGIEVDGLLLRSPRELVGITDETLFAGFFSRTEVDDDAVLPLLQLRLHGDQARDSVELRWRPTADDLASLRLAVEFSHAPCLRLETAGPATATAFCGAAEVRAVEGDKRAAPLTSVLHEVANDVFESGLLPAPLRRVAAEWTACVERARGMDALPLLEALALAGSVAAMDNTSVGLGVLSPLKAEWAAASLETLREVAREALLTAHSPEADAERLEVRSQAAAALGRATSCHYPAFIRLAADNRPLLPVSESRTWSAYASEFGAPSETYAEGAVGGVLNKLLTLQPEVGGHLKCLAFGPGAASLLVRQVLRLLGCKVGKGRLESCEIVCVGEKPSADALAAADAMLGGHSRHLLRLRYFKDFDEAARHLPSAVGSPAAHLAVVTGLSNSVARLSLDMVGLRMPEREDDVLVTPKTWVRPGASRRMLLAPPGVTEAGAAWLALATAIDYGWSDCDEVRVPELNPSPGKVKSYLKAVHDMSLWVATVDRYASRDAIERAMGEDVAILHQERRLSAESPLGLVISQRSGGSADRAIARSLRSARIVSDEETSRDIGRKLREVASQGHGVLALEAATSGSGINELVAHVVSFSLLGSKATPWPLPPDCRVLLVSLDEYASWFSTGKRADLLALALDKENKGVHVAAIEVKARRSDAKAEAEAIDQLRHTLTATQYAAYHDPSHLYTRVWLNRIAEAAYSVAREIGFRLEPAEIEAIEAFRRGEGVQEWAAIALIFGPNLQESERHYFHNRFGDRVPIAVHTMRLSQDLLEEATKASLINLKTVETEKGPLPGGRQRRRPEKGVPRPERQEGGDDGNYVAPQAPPVSVEGGAEEAVPGQAVGAQTQDGVAIAAEPRREGEFVAPLLGWRMTDGQPVLWRSAGPQAELTNGHMEIWGASGKGKTQFTMSLLAQLSAKCGSRFGIADFKNDYGGTFPAAAGARFIDLWTDGAPYNPLALLTTDGRSVEAAIIEIRDVVDIAAQTFAHMGHRQLGKLRQALETAYRECREEGRWPTLKTLDDHLDQDLRGVIGDLTRNRLFRDGPPLGEVISENVVFGLSNIPGTGLTTVLAGGFILSALLQKVMSLPQVAKQIRYVAVVDEAHRVAGFRSIHTMIREGRSKGLAVILATQQPSDLPQEVATNAQTKICFQLDAMMAKAAAKRLDPGDRSLPDQIRNLAEGEAFISLGNSRPVLVRMAQLWRDGPDLLR